MTLNSGDVNIKVALGVALGRLDRPDDAVEVLRAAVSQDQGNPWAHRNLGAMLMKVGQPTEALPHFQAATRLLPKDQIAWIGLADANRQVGKAKNAADAYRVAVEINPHSDLAEQARAGSNALSQSGFDKVRQVTPRQDAVHYCLGAMQQLSNMDAAELKKLTLELAMVGGPQRIRGPKSGQPVSRQRIGRGILRAGDGVPPLCVHAANCARHGHRL